MHTDARTIPATRTLVLASSCSALALSAATLLLIPSALRGILSSGFLPHAYCYLYNKQLIALHVGSDVAIWLSYVAISCTLAYLVWRTRSDVPFSWMFLAFGLFIVACGFTHFMEVVVLWKPLYWLAGDVKLVTAVASVVTAIALPGLIPQVHKMVTAASLSEERRVQLEKANEGLQHLSVHVLNVQDEERRRVARELHDGVGQYLVAIKMSCDRALAASRDAAQAGALRESISLLERCTSEVRTLSHLLHPPLLEEIGLASAIPWYAEGFTERSGVAVQVELPEGLERLPQPMELVLFRVLQESLTNIHRHARTKTALVALEVQDGHARLVVEDGGQGFDFMHGQPEHPGVGIASMRERVREAGGEFRITSSPRGTRVEATIPLS
jgi:signal transduction histidine kinase